MDSSQSLHVQPATFAADNLSHIHGWMYLMQAHMVSGSITSLSIVVRIFLPETITIQKSRGQSATLPRKEIYHILIFPNQIIGFDEEETYQAQNIDSETGNELDHESGVTYRGSIDLIERFMKDRKIQKTKQELDTFVKQIMIDVKEEDFEDNLGLEFDDFDDFIDFNDFVKTDKQVEHEAFRQEIREIWQALITTEQIAFQQQQAQFITATSGNFIRYASYRRFKDETLTRAERINKWNKLTLDDKLPFLYYEFQVRKQRQKKKKRRQQQL